MTRDLLLKRLGPALKRLHDGHDDKKKKSKRINYGFFCAGYCYGTSDHQGVYLYIYIFASLISCEVRTEQDSFHLLGWLLATAY